MKFLLSLLFFIIFQNYFAQTAIWNLQQCVDYAQKHNIAIKQAQIQTQINKNNTLQSQAALLPSINMGAQHTYNFGQTLDRYTNKFATSQVLSQNFNLQSNVTLWSGFSQLNNIKANKYQYLASTETLQQQQYDLALNVATAYINVIFSDEISKISNSQFELTKQQLERTEKLANAGTLAKNAIWDLKAQLANDGVNVTTSTNNYQIAILTLIQLINVDTVKNFTVAYPEIDMLSNELSVISVQNIYETALKNQHSIKSAGYSLLAAEKNLAVARGKFSPTIGATGNIGTGTSGLAKNIDGYNITGYDTTGFTTNGALVITPKGEPITSNKSFKSQFKDNVNKSFGFTISVPIFNGLQTVTSVKNAKLNTLNAKYNQELIEQNLYKTVAQAYANAKAGLDKYNANKLSVEASEQSFNFAQQKFNVGAISTFEYNTSKNRLQNAQGNLVQAKYDYLFKLKVLDYYQGKELKF